MKFAAVATAAALVAATNAASCDVTSLQTLLTSSDTTTCASDSGYTVTSLATPTDAEMAIMCTRTACQSVLTQLQTLAPSECTLGAFSLYADLITPLTNYCSGGSSTTAAGSSATTATAGSSATTATAGSSATTATVGSTTGSTTSGTVTTSSTGSAASTPATSSGSSTSETATSSSAASAAASASTSGSSGASMAAISAGAVLAAVAAAFF